jgi:predicted AlkP superfamily phosphohydrolase/phosphomutase
MKDDKENRNRVVVVGLDGASWNILNPLIGNGKLPTIEKILREGSYGSLKSILPPVSVPAWKCYSTGKNPGKLGVYDMLVFDFEHKKLRVPSSYYFKSKEIWDHVGNQGDISCVLGMFATHPAREIHGCMISDMPNERGFYPKELKEELEERFGYLYVEPKFTTEREDTYFKVLEGFEREFDVLI